MTRANDAVRHCDTLGDVRRAIDALDDVLVPLLVTRAGYMTEAARIKETSDQVRDEARIADIVRRVRAKAQAEGGDPALMEVLYRALMETCIAHEAHEFERLRAGAAP
ncbi:MAG: chorismate mutase [Burkholderiaceae bacterium]|jgi:isochorismate pyruvate lyase|nr:MAG: chorismate mutase [Burkholderiaceae bacterium]